VDVNGEKPDRRSLKQAARELQESYKAAFHERGGDLHVTAGWASDTGTRTKSLELYAGVEWEASRVYDHVHADVHRRRWFSRRWEAVRPLEAAFREIEGTLREWLREHP